MQLHSTSFGDTPDPIITLRPVRGQKQVAGSPTYCASGSGFVPGRIEQQGTKPLPVRAMDPLASLAVCRF